jgi:hypothetical protein
MLLNIDSYLNYPKLLTFTCKYKHKSLANLICWITEIFCLCLFVESGCCRRWREWDVKWGGDGQLRGHPRDKIWPRDPKTKGQNSGVMHSPGSVLSAGVLPEEIHDGWDQVGGVVVNGWSYGYINGGLIGG